MQLCMQFYAPNNGHNDIKGTKTVIYVYIYIFKFYQDYFWMSKTFESNGNQRINIVTFYITLRKSKFVWSLVLLLINFILLSLYIYMFKISGIFSFKNFLLNISRHFILTHLSYCIKYSNYLFYELFLHWFEYIWSNLYCTQFRMSLRC